MLKTQEICTYRKVCAVHCLISIEISKAMVTMVLKIMVYLRNNFMKSSGVGLRLWSLVSVLLLAACSSGKIVKTYDGDVLPKQQLAVLTANEDIVLISVNGKAVPKYLVSGIDANYGLMPGENLVVFHYASVWGNPNRVDKDAPRGLQVESSQKEVLIKAESGSRYTFRYRKPASIREARVLASEFEADIVDQQLQVIAQSGEIGRYQSRIPSTADGLAVAESKVAPTISAGKALSTIEALQALWGTASKEEQKAFLKWAFQ